MSVKPIQEPVPIIYPYEEHMPFPKWIRERNDLTWGEKIYLAEIISIDKITDHKCYYSIISLAARFFVSPPTIYNWTRKLKDLGLIQILVNLDGDRNKSKIIMPFKFI